MCQDWGQHRADSGPKAHVTANSSITIKMWWKFYFPLILNFAPGTTAVLYIWVKLNGRILHMKFILCLTHWGRVMHICVSKLTSIGSDTGLLPGRCQAIVWTNAGILLIEPWGSTFRGILIESETFPFKKTGWQVLSAKWRPCCLSLNVLKTHSNHRFCYIRGN